MKKRQLERSRRSVLASLLALILVAAGILVTVAAFQVHAHRDLTVLGRVSSVVDRLRQQAWSDGIVLAAGIVLAVLGLLLVIMGLLPARRPMVPLADLDSHTISGITRRGLIRDLTATAASVDGVVGAKVSLHGRRVRVRAKSGMSDRRALGDAVRTVVEKRLASVQPTRAIRVRTRVIAGRS